MAVFLSWVFSQAPKTIDVKMIWLREESRVERSLRANHQPRASRKYGPIGKGDSTLHVTI